MTIDSSPLLNHIYFPAGSSNMLARYVLFADQGQAEAFMETELKTTMEKYDHILNVIGKRLKDNPDPPLSPLSAVIPVSAMKRSPFPKDEPMRVKRYFTTIWGH